MKTVFVFLICANVLFAQIPSPKGDISTQSLPVLQEWWRADNMGYGIAYNGGNGGMTWLENFYHGKGALVISTPTGVKTWQLRYPWDTVNVFTWQGGDANIKTGDFNGDGVTDYLDDKGNIYIGTENGKPPLLSDKKINHLIGQRRVFVTDINKDGKSDILSFASTIYPSKIFGQVFFGTTDIKNIHTKSIYQSGTIDTNSSAYCIYENSKKEIRLINRYYQKGSSDGYTLYSVSINNIDSTPVLNKLHEYFVSDRQETCGRTYAIITDDTKHTIHWVALEMINERRELTNVTVYDVSNDTFNKLYSVRMDSVTTIGSYNHNVSNDGIKDFYVVRWKVDLLSKIMVFSGDISSSFTQLSEYKLCQYQGCTTVNDLNNDGISDIVIRGEYLDDNCFRVLLSSKTTSIDDTLIHNESFSIRYKSTLPIRNNQDIELEIKSQQPQTINYEIIDVLGKTYYTRRILTPTDISNVLLPVSQLTLSVGKYFIRCYTNVGSDVLQFYITE